MDSTLNHRIGRIIDLFSKKIKNNPLVASVILCSFYFLLAVIFCDPKYEATDDFFADVILSGGMTGEPDAHVLFSNILLAYVLKFFYSIIPTISIYFVMLELMGFISLVIVVWLVLRNCRVSIGLLVSVIFLSCFSDDVFVLVQFTKVASISILAGGFLFLEGIWNKEMRYKKAAVVAGSVLFLWGTMLRFESLYCVILFIFIRFVFYAVHGNIKSILVKLLICLVLLGSSYGLTTVNNMIWDSDPDYKYYRELNKVRAPITDYSMPDYEIIEGELTEIGISQIDYYMATRWGITDMSVFTQDKLEQMVSINERHKADSTLSDAFGRLQARMIWLYPGALGLWLLTIIFVLYDKKAMLIVVSSLIACLGLLFAFAYMGRIVYRIEYSVLFAASAVLAVSFGMKPRELAIRKELYHVAIIAVFMVVSLYHIGTYIPDMSYKTLDDDSYAKRMDNYFGAMGYHHELYTAVVSPRRPHEELLSFMENDGHYFLLDVEPLMNIYLDYKPWIRADYEKLNCHDLGGCFMMQYPGETLVYEKNGIDPIDPYKSLVNDDVYVIDNYFYLVKLAYIRYHYYPDAQIEFIGEKSGCKIWRYYLPE